MESPFTVCSAVLAYVEAALINAGRPVSDKMVAVGGVAVDDCCAGLLLVAPERIYRTVAPFPTEAGPDDRCQDTPIAVDLLVLIERCVPVIDDRGNAPSIASQEAAYESVLLDTALAWNALAGAALLGDDGTGDPLWERSGLAQSFIGPEGGCVGVETRLTIGVPSALWCP